MAERRHGPAGAPPAMPESSVSPEAIAAIAATAKAAADAPGINLRQLIERYQNDPDSSFQKLRYQTRGHYISLCRRIAADHGDVAIKEMTAREIYRWHEDWTSSGKAIARALITMLRGLFSFGMVVLEDQDCTRVSTALSKMRFEIADPRIERLTIDHVRNIRAEAHRTGLISMALAQSLQFECGLRQKVAIGEWVPENEAGESNVKQGGKKWLRGLRWEQLDDKFTLRYIHWRKAQPVEINLKMKPMVLADLYAFAGIDPEDSTLVRDMLPREGPMIVYEKTSLPYSGHYFRELWREIAEKAGVPKNVKNMDSRTQFQRGKSENQEDQQDKEAVDLTLEIQGQEGLPH